MKTDSNSQNPLPWTGIRNGIIHDARAGRLSDRAFRLFAISLLLTHGSRSDGSFPAEASTPEELMWVAHLSGDVDAASRELLTAGLWTEADGDWAVTDMADFVYVSGQSAEGQRNAFKRHHPKHVSKGKLHPDCHLCQEEQMSSTLSADPKPDDGRSGDVSSTTGAISADERDGLLHVIDGFHNDELDPEAAYGAARHELRQLGVYPDSVIDRLVAIHAAA